MVTIEATGLGEVLACRIDPSLVVSGDRELIEDLVPAAVNQALAKAKQLHAEAMQSMTAELDVPGMDAMLSQLSGGGSDEPTT
jgi:DNA-binding protein YbaB